MISKTLIVTTAALLTFGGTASAENTGTIVQNGNGNSASMIQVGHRNDGTVAQFGDGNVAGMRQRGTYNNGAIGQNGNGNLARLKQLGF